jgi:hypothetical protein
MQRSAKYSCCQLLEGVVLLLLLLLSQVQDIT